MENFLFAVKRSPTSMVTSWEVQSSKLKQLSRSRISKVAHTVPVAISSTWSHGKHEAHRGLDHTLLHNVVSSSLCNDGMSFAGSCQPTSAKSGTGCIISKARNRSQEQVASPNVDSEIFGVALSLARS